jgi:hypothetical protein
MRRYLSGAIEVKGWLVKYKGKFKVEMIDFDLPSTSTYSAKHQYLVNNEMLFVHIQMDKKHLPVILGVPIDLDPIIIVKSF